jgi:hypothetical protein
VFSAWKFSVVILGGSSAGRYVALAELGSGSYPWPRFFMPLLTWSLSRACSPLP